LLGSHPSAARDGRAARKDCDPRPWGGFFHPASVKKEDKSGGGRVLFVEGGKKKKISGVLHKAACKTVELWGEDTFQFTCKKREQKNNIKESVRHHSFFSLKADDPQDPREGVVNDCFLFFREGGGEEEDGEDCYNDAV